MPYRLELQSVAEEIRVRTENVISRNMRDPDLAEKSADYRDGYAQGFREATAAFIAQRLRDTR